MRRWAMTGARSSRVSTAWTPGAARAAVFETERMSARAWGLRTKATCSTPGTTISSTKRPRPRSNASSSMRERRDPISDCMFFIPDGSDAPSIRCRGFGGLVGDALGRRIDLRQQGVDVLGAYGIDVEILHLGLGQEIAVPHGLVEGRDQGAPAVCRQAGRRRERPRDLLADQDELDDLQLFLVPGEVDSERYIGQPRFLFQSRLDDDVDRFVVEPVGMAALQGAPGQPAESVDLSALHGERDIIGARIAGDQLGFGAEDVSVQLREHVRIGTRTLAAERGRLGEKVIPRPDPGGAPGDAEARILGNAAEPGEFRSVECR